AIGIEILIVFIAIVLVAAVSAAVLIQTVGFLQQKAMTTGRETTKEVASGIKVVKVLGNVTSPRTSSAVVDKLAIFIEVNTGGHDVDLAAARVILSNETKTVTLAYNTSPAAKAFADYKDTGLDNLFDNTAWTNLTNASLGHDSTKEFGIIVLQDEDGSLSPDYPVLNQGDKVILIVDANSVFGGLPPREKVSGEVRPEFGAPGIIEFTTPPSYTQVIVELQ
ncbi:flagellin, partial [Geoglobus sp.]